MTYSLSREEVEEVRDLIRLLNSRIDSGGDGEEPTVELDKEGLEQVARLAQKIQMFIS